MDPLIALSTVPAARASRSIVGHGPLAGARRQRATAQKLAAAWRLLSGHASQDGRLCPHAHKSRPIGGGGQHLLVAADSSGDGYSNPSSRDPSSRRVGWQSDQAGDQIADRCNLGGRGAVTPQLPAHHHSAQVGQHQPQHHRSAVEPAKEVAALDRQPGDGAGEHKGDRTVAFRRADHPADQVRQLLLQAGQRNRRRVRLEPGRE